jgi:Uma2 family endonuclease
MSVATHPIAPAPPAATVPAQELWPISVETYHAMIRAGILTEDDPVELLGGCLVTKMPKNPPHTLATELTRETLAKLVPPGWFVNGQEPITTEDSEPEPDVAVIRGDRRDYVARHPGPADLGLVVEVADASLARDRVLKKRLYAAAGIPAYWVLNLVEGVLETYADPTGPAEAPDYRQRQEYGPSDAVPVVLDGNEVGRVPVRELLP